VGFGPGFGQGFGPGFARAESGSDPTPDQFTFVDQTDVPLSTVVVSNELGPTAFDTPAAISVVGGEYSLDGGAWTSAPGTINPGQMVRVRHTSSASNSTATNTVLTIDSVSDTFTSTTLAAQGPITSASGRKRDSRRRGWLARWMNRG
jgi:hypothetical protein